jgi:hypothetical protein
MSNYEAKDMFDPYQWLLCPTLLTAWQLLEVKNIRCWGCRSILDPVPRNFVHILQDWEALKHLEEIPGGKVFDSL